MSLIRISGLLIALVGVVLHSGCSPMREIAHAPTRTALRWWGIGYSDGYHRCPTVGVANGIGPGCSTCNFVAPAPSAPSFVAPAMYPNGSAGCQACQSGITEFYPVPPASMHQHYWDHVPLPAARAPSPMNSNLPKPTPPPIPAPQNSTEEDDEIWGFESSPSDRKPDGSAQPRAAVERHVTPMATARSQGWNPRRSMR